MPDSVPFFVRGPFEVPTHDLIQGREVDEAKLGEFWTSIEGAGRERGCYVFAIRSGRGITPFYVGKTARDFFHEAFTSDKLKKYNHALGSVLKGAPVMFFVSAPPARGKVNRRAITDLEDYLIQIAVSRNPEKLLNIVGINDGPKWSIEGVIRQGVGKPSNAAEAFRRAMGIQQES